MSESIKNLFGEEAISYEELIRRAEDAKVKIGDLTEAEAAHRKELDGICISHALERGLERLGAKNADLVRRAIRLETVSVENGKVVGLDEQLSALQASDPYLFRERETVRTGGEHGQSFRDPDSMSDADFYKIRFGCR